MQLCAPQKGKGEATQGDEMTSIIALSFRYVQNSHHFICFMFAGICREKKEEGDGK